MKNIQTLLRLTLGTICLIMVPSEFALGQRLQVIERPAEAIRVEGAVIRRMELLGFPQPIAQDQGDVGVESGATLKTDPRLESILEKADRFREDGNYRFAAQLWQAVLLQSGDALFWNIHVYIKERLFLPIEK